MDHARGISPRSTVDALVHGLMCIPKLIVLGILLFLVELAVFLVIAILLFICKIPFLGPVLFIVVFPVSVVVAGITVLGLVLCMLLSLPAIWQGATIMRALSQTLAIARSRIVEAILLLAVVWLLAFVVALIVFGVLFSGLLPTLGISASIVGFGGLGSMMGGMGGMGGMSGMGGMGGGGVGHAIAGGLGLGGALGDRRVAGGAGLPARPVPRLPAGHRRPGPQRHRGGAAAEARRGAQPRQRSRREGACRGQPRHRADAPPPRRRCRRRPTTRRRRCSRPSRGAAAGGAPRSRPPVRRPRRRRPTRPPRHYMPETPPAASTDIDLPFDDVAADDASAAPDLLAAGLLAAGLLPPPARRRAGRCPSPRPARSACRRSPATTSSAASAATA